MASMESAGGGVTVAAGAASVADSGVAWAADGAAVADSDDPDVASAEGEATAGGVAMAGSCSRSEINLQGEPRGEWT